MARNDKHAKSLKRREKVARDARRREMAKANREYPAIVMVPNDAPDEFVAAVREAAKAIDFRNREEFHDWEATHYRNIRSRGAANATLEVWVTPDEARDPAFNRAELMAARAQHFTHNLGERIFQRIPRDVLLRHVPYHDVFFLPQGYQIHAVFRSLQRAKGPHGSIYFSRSLPKMVVNGRRLTVGFSHHAVQRMCERLAEVWPSYENLGAVFGFIDHLEEMEPMWLNGEPAFTLFSPCFLNSWQRDVAKTIFGDAYDPKADYCMRLGYFPVVIEGEFAKAMTMLYPGYKATPEHQAIHAADLDWTRKRALLEQAERLDARAAADPESIGIMKWFQANGVEQVQKRKAKFTVRI